MADADTSDLPDAIASAFGLTNETFLQPDAASTSAMGNSVREAAIQILNAAFTASTVFEGARSGFVFKLGASGLGYYRDHGWPSDSSSECMPVAAERRAAAFIASTACKVRCFGLPVPMPMRSRWIIRRRHPPADHKGSDPAVCCPIGQAVRPGR